MIDFQSAATVLHPCPSGTFENSQQHARVIHGWVRRLLKTKSPEGTTEILPGLAGLWLSGFYFHPLLAFAGKISVNQCRLAVKKAILPNEPKLKIAKHCKSTGCEKAVWLRFQNEPISGEHVVQVFPFKVSQGHSRLFKAAQTYSSVFGKKILLFSLRRPPPLHAPSCQRKEGKCS